MTENTQTRTRYARVTGARRESEVAAYLPDNYRISDVETPEGEWVIEGEDAAGWTLDDYVIPRFGSGLIQVAEIVLLPGQDPERAACPHPNPCYYETEEGALGHGWYCGSCGGLLQVG